MIWILGILGAVLRFFLTIFISILIIALGALAAMFFEAPWLAFPAAVLMMIFMWWAIGSENG